MTIVQTQADRATERRWQNHYDRSARRYDVRETLWGLLLGYWDPRERRRLVDLLGLRPGQRLLEVGAGTGANLTVAAQRLGDDGRLVGADISRSMLEVCRAKLARERVPSAVVTSDAARLPFADGVFDAVLQFGTISMLSDVGAALHELVRVAKPGGRVVIGDVGLHPGLRHTLRAKVILRFSPRYASLPPTEFPLGMREVRSSFLKSRTCYVLDFVTPGGPE